MYLGFSKKPFVVESLIEGLKDPELSVRLSCLSALGKIGTPEAVAGLRLGLDDPVPEIRQVAGEILSKIEAGASQA